MSCPTLAKNLGAVCHVRNPQRAVAKLALLLNGKMAE
jgi:hypothetical protein